MSSISQSQIIVLHLTKYGDSGAIIHVLDSISGRRSLYVRGIGKNKNNAVYSIFHNLNILEAVVWSSYGSSLCHLKESCPIFELSSLKSDIYKRSVAIFISEVLYRSIGEGGGDTGLFSWLCDEIVKLDSMKQSCANFHIWFLVWFCCKMGFLPKDNYGEGNVIFDIICASFVSSVNDDTSVFSCEDSVILHKILISSFDEVMQMHLSGEQRCRFSSKMIEYLSYHLGMSVNVKSLAVLHDIFC